MLVRGVQVLYEFEQHAAGGRGVYERHEAPARAHARLLVDEARALAFEARERRAYVRDAHRDVVNPRPALLKKLRDGRGGAGRLKEFYARLARGQHRHAHALLLHRLRVFDFEPERVAPETQRLFDAARSDAYVINLHGFLFDARRVFSSLKISGESASGLWPSAVPGALVRPQSFAPPPAAAASSSSTAE